MLTLTISHFIYLTKEQRLNLTKKIPIETTGISVPVWFKMGSTSEPAKEVFCRYVITNDEKETLVEKTNDGFSINLPQKLFIKYNPTENLFSAVLQSNNLNDLPNDDSGVLEFVYQKEDKEKTIINFVEIKDIKKLTDSLSFL